MPRGAMRILNAGKVQAAFRAAGRTTSEDTGERKRPRDDDAGTGSKRQKKDKAELPKIAPNESLGEYNRRIEALLRPSVGGAIKKAEAARGAAKKQGEDEKKARVAKAQGKTGVEKEEVETEVRFNKPEKSFAQKERRRLNDVAQAPPSLPRLRMAEKPEKKAKRSERDPLNAGQRRIMEVERERVVAMYRELKAKKEAERAK